MTSSSLPFTNGRIIFPKHCKTNHTNKVIDSKRDFKCVCNINEGNFRIQIRNENVKWKMCVHINTMNILSSYAIYNESLYVFCLIYKLWDYNVSFTWICVQLLSNIDKITAFYDLTISFETVWLVVAAWMRSRSISIPVY